ncbi:helix-turn-helix domain-containing protein [Candidatus Saccharibacteria bacterium]|nr:helix-turn-helix domain-containing protein [Candidatus Saccharibacteria bacterium]
MAAKPHERTLQMMENFLKLHNEGYSIKEIAKMYNLSEYTVYNRLGEIAEKEGVTRDELLKKPFFADHSGRNFTPVMPIDRTKFNQNYDELIIRLDSILEGIDETINQIESDLIMED